MSDGERVETDDRSDHERRLQRLLQMCGIGRVFWDLRTNEVSIDATARSIYGMDADAPIDGDLLAGMVHPDDAAQSMNAVQTALNGQPSTAEVRLVRPSGEVFHSRAQLALDETGGLLLGTVEDVSAERAALERAEVIARNAAERQRLELLGRVSASVAHDFNNTLCVISALADVALLNIESGARADELVGDLHAIAQSVGAAARVTRQLLSVSRKQVVSPVALELDDAVAATLDLTGSLLRENIELEFSPDAPGATVSFDRGNLEQIVLNLCLNARDAIPRSGRIELSTHRTDDGGAMLRVADDGAGMDAATLEQVFEPFFTTREDRGGTGLGLWSVWTIARQGGADVRVRSTVGAGTVFEVHFATIDHPPATELADPDVLPRGDETILLAEDEVSLRTVLKRALEGQGYRVVAAPDTATGLARGAGLPSIDLLVTDLVMPGSDGTVLSHELLDRHPGMRVVFMSGYSERGLVHPEQVERAPLLAKPFTIRTLLHQVRETLDADRAAA